MQIDSFNHITARFTIILYREYNKLLPLDCPASAPAPAPLNTIVCPSPCSNQPCTEDEDNCCAPGQSKPNGCNQCQANYFKKSYNHPCVHCQATFGDKCLFCQDFNGCGQCSSDCQRVWDEVCSLWKCHCGTPAPTAETTRIQIEPTSFSGVHDPSLSWTDEDDDPPIEEDTIITVGDIYEESQILEVLPDGRQYLTIHSPSYLQYYVDISNDPFEFSESSDGDGSDMDNETLEGGFPTECELEVNDAPDGFDDDDDERRRLRLVTLDDENNYNDHDDFNISHVKVCCAVLKTLAQLQRNNV